MIRRFTNEIRCWRATGQFAASVIARSPSTTMLMLFGIILCCCQSTARADDSSRSGPEWVREGNRLLASDQPEQALEAFDQAATLLPESAAVSYNRGIALYRLQRFDEAETALQNALRPDATDLEADVKYNLGRAAQARALANRGDAEASLAQTERAIQFYQDALDVRPDDADAKRNLSQAEQFQRFLKKLIEMLKQEQEEKPDDQQSPSSQPNEDENEKQDQSGDPSDQGEDDQQQEGSDSQDSQEQNESDGEQSESDQKQSGESESENKDGESESKQEQVGEQKPADDEESEGKQNQPQQNGADEAQESRDDRSEQQKGDDQLEDMAQSQPATESEQEGQASDDAEAMEMQNATTQQATSQPTETIEERTKRLSIEQALRLLQEARDKEAQRRDALRAARRRSQGRTDVDKDW